MACYFNPRAPCGARRGDIDEVFPEEKFQSTRPVRGATPSPPPRWRICWHFNPRAPCGARPACVRGLPGDPGISIHAPRAGRDGNPVLTLLAT